MEVNKSTNIILKTFYVYIFLDFRDMVHCCETCKSDYPSTKWATGKVTAQGVT